MPATPTAATTDSRTSAGTASAMIARTSSASDASSSRRGGSECRWRSVWRTTPACVEMWKVICPPSPTTYSVEPPPMSITTSGPSPAGRSAVAPRYVSRASVSPAITLASSPWRRRTSSRNCSPLAASRTALVSTPVVTSHRCSSIAAA